MVSVPIEGNIKNTYNNCHSRESVLAFLNKFLDEASYVTGFL